MIIWTLSGSQLQAVVLTTIFSDAEKWRWLWPYYCSWAMLPNTWLNWASLWDWLEWVVHHSSGSSFTAVGLVGKAMMAIPLIPGCRFWEAPSGLSVLVCFWRRALAQAVFVSLRFLYLLAFFLCLVYFFLSFFLTDLWRSPGTWPPNLSSQL